MPIADYSTYVSKISNPTQRIQDTKSSVTTTAGRLSNFWTAQAFPGSVPTTAAVCDLSTSGSLGQQNGLGTQRLAQVAVSLGNSGYVIIADRLIHSGGLSGIETAEQSVNTPSLTRYTDGVGVFACLDVYTSVGNTQQVATVSYTNQDGTSGRTGYSIIGGSGFNVANRSLIISLQAGDSGVRSVESVTLAGSTATAGNFGVTLFKPIYFMPVPNLGAQQFLFDSVLTCCGNMPIVQNDACLYYLVSSFTSSTGIYQSAIRFIED